MKQEIFQERHEPEWQALEQWLQRRARPRVQERSRDAEGVFGDLEFPGAYRRVCQHLALAQRRGYSVVLIDRLQDLVHRGHLVLYRPRSPRLQAVVHFFAAEFPRLVRSRWRAMWLSAALMFLPMLTIMVLLQYRPELVHSIMPASQIAKLEAMYDPAERRQARPRKR